jgi:hypothetical protein
MRGSHTTLKEPIVARTERGRHVVLKIHAPNIFQSRGANFEALLHDASTLSPSHNETPLNMVLTSLTERGRITPSRSCSDTHLLTVQHQATTCLGIQPHSEGSHSLVQDVCLQWDVHRHILQSPHPHSPHPPCISGAPDTWGGIHPMRRW